MMNNKYHAALEELKLDDAAKARLASSVIEELEKKRQKKRTVRRVLVPALSAAVLCVVAVPLAFAFTPAGAEDPDYSEPPAGDELPSEDDLPEGPEAFSGAYEAGGVRLCFNFDLNEIR